jgi:hypothetical protein
VNALDFFRGTKWVRKSSSCISGGVKVMFVFRLEEMTQFGSDTQCFVPCDSAWYDYKES